MHHYCSKQKDTPFSYPILIWGENYALSKHACVEDSSRTCLTAIFTHKKAFDLF